MLLVEEVGSVFKDILHDVGRRQCYLPGVSAPASLTCRVPMVILCRRSEKVMFGKKY